MAVSKIVGCELSECAKRANLTGADYSSDQKGPRGDRAALTKQKDHVQVARLHATVVSQCFQRRLLGKLIPNNYYI